MPPAPRDLPAPPPPSPDDLRALAAKYRTLVAWRRRRDADHAAPSAQELRAMARAFPGALRELDTLGEGELDRRAALAARAAAGGPREPWMAWVHTMHRLLAAALCLKTTARTSRAQLDAPPVHRTAAARQRADEIAGWPLPATLVDALAKPPGGRTTPVVLAQIAALFARPVDEIAAILFPSRRRP